MIMDKYTSHTQAQAHNALCKTLLVSWESQRDIYVAETHTTYKLLEIPVCIYVQKFSLYLSQF